tara:strand:- start:263 stop:580 length:318 start_codon:yes stop_codon:yes gene_type:complete
MIIYNVTCSVDSDIVEDWLDWMKKNHIPDILDTGFFIRATINRVISELDGQYTYAIKYYCINFKSLKAYHRSCANRFKDDHFKRYGNKVLSFRTVLREIDSFNYS